MEQNKKVIDLEGSDDDFFDHQDMTFADKEEMFDGHDQILDNITTELQNQTITLDRVDSSDSPKLVKKTKPFKN